jgi:uncharacterized protein YjbJ (UPF0337 family)
MNWDTVAGNWKQLKGKVRREWGELTNDEVDIINGNREQLIGMLQERYGIARDQAENEVKRFVSSL